MSALSLPPQYRLLIDNDYGGDPDGLVQLVHHLLSPSADIRAVIASHLGHGPSGGRDRDGSAAAERAAHDIFGRLGVDPRGLIVRGAEQGLVDPGAPHDTPAARTIIAEALRDDDKRLFYAAGGGLTDLASALLLCPEIADRLTLIWIGGPEHDGLAPPLAHAAPVEYNLDIDVIAAQVVFDTARLEIWQVPRDAYRQCLVSIAELSARLRRSDIGQFLCGEIDRERTQLAARGGRNIGESYDLGDSALVLLTALQSTFEPDTASSAYVIRDTPAISEDGQYERSSRPRPMRIYTKLDTRLVFEDLFAKIDAHARGRTTDRAPVAT